MIKAIFAKILVEVAGDKTPYAALFKAEGSSWKVRVGIHKPGENNPAEILEIGTLSNAFDVIDAENAVAKYIRVKKRDK